MATTPISGLPSVPPMPAVARILARFDRPQVEGFIAVAIELLDTLDGDTEKEDGGDDELTGDEQGDQAFTEWHTRGRHKLAAFGAECGPSAYGAVHEDAEDDDQDEGVEDNPLGIDPEEDRCLAGDDGCGAFWKDGNLHWGSHEDEPFNPAPVADLEAYREQRARARKRKRGS